MIALLLACCSGLAFSTRYDLGGTEWQFRSSNSSIRGSAVVPGDIYQDLQRAGIIGEPLYGEGDVDLRWVPRTDWVYERKFDLPTQGSGKGKNAYLYANGLDTVAAVYLNDALLGRTYNQFVEYRYDVSKYLTSSGNRLRIEFQSPVNYAQNQSSSYKAEYSHSIPPDCPPDVYNGECNANFIRKAQASFSWDWGPSFPTVGIWRSIYLEFLESMHIERVSPLITAGADSFHVAVDAHILCAAEVASVRVSLTIPELRIEQNSTVAVSCAASANQSVRTSVSVNKNKVKLWYPHGYGEPKLYKLRLLVQADGGPATKKVVNIGFRTIELVQDFIDSNVESKGRHFYFKVNGIPIFLKGTNWIPVSSFPSRNHRLRRRFHLDSLLDANMNSIRIWGGGLYEEDDFYDHCDQNGILIWHDFMFACAAYPTNKAFLDSVSEEIESQVYRLRHRPSILIWGGNNENELAIQTGWWFEVGYSKNDMTKDYKTLYKDLMKPLVTSLDASRPFVLSSPSDGVETERQGGLAQNPGDNLYGDVHFYNEAVNLWQDQSYPIPRCATEYGVQSIPMRSTMLKWINASEWHYGSKSMTQRQHHPGGVINQLMMSFQHFEVAAKQAMKEENMRL